jgi:hypothetical protein
MKPAAHNHKKEHKMPFKKKTPVQPDVEPVSPEQPVSANAEIAPTVNATSPPPLDAPTFVGSDDKQQVKVNQNALFRLLYALLTDKTRGLTGISTLRVISDLFGTSPEDTQRMKETIKAHVHYVRPI